MKKFIVSVLGISMFFFVLGGLVENAGARFKSDEKALELLRKARAAVGGDAAISGVKSMTITGKATKTFEIDGAARSEQGDLEINFELPNKMSKQVKIGAGDGNALVDKKVDVVVVRKGDGDNLQWRSEGGDKTIVIRKKDGTTEEIKTDGKEPIILKKADVETVVSEDGKTATVDDKKIFIRKADAPNGEYMRSNELFRTTLSLLLTAPEGLDVSYSYVGEGTVDGAACEIIAANDGGSTVKLYLDKSTNLPRMMTFQSHKPVIVMFRRAEVPQNSAVETKIFERKMDAPEMAEFQVKFSDFRSVGGLQLPFKWTQTVAGKNDEVLEITSYEINPANIADKFKEMPVKVLVKTNK